MTHIDPSQPPVAPEPCRDDDSAQACFPPACDHLATPGINLIPSIADLIFCVLLLVLSFSSDSGLLRDGDTGYHIRAGQYIIGSLSVPRLDIFSFHTPPLPWTAHEWLSEVIMAAVHGLAGLTGVVVFFSILLACSYAFLFKALRSYGASPLPAATLTLVVCIASQSCWLARPHLFSFLLMIGWHQVLESWQRGSASRLYLLPLSMLIWVNLHGGFLGGFLILSAYLIGNLFSVFLGPVEERDSSRRRLHQLLLTSGACLIACLCNPRGYHILFFPFQLVSNRLIMDHVIEFLSPDFHQFQPFKYLLLLLLALFALSRQRVEARELVLILIFTNMALYSARYIPLFALVMAPVLIRHTEQGMPGSDRFWKLLEQRSGTLARLDAQATGLLWPAAALLVVALAQGSGRIHHGFDARAKAVAAVEFLMREKISGNMFNDDEFGDYLIYRAFPGYRVFFDGRSDMYGTNKLKEYLKVTNFEPGWEQILDKYRITWIFYTTNSTLSRFLLNDKDWVLIYSDKVASIFVRDLPQHHRLIAKYRLPRLAQVDTDND